MNRPIWSLAACTAGDEAYVPVNGLPDDREDVEPLTFTFHSSAGVVGPVPSSWSDTGPDGATLPDGYDRWCKVWVAGPDVPQADLPHPEGTAALPRGRNHPKGRLEDDQVIAIDGAAGDILVE